MNTPKNQKAAVLKLLLRKKGISEAETSYNGFRSRLSEIRKSIEILYEVKPFVNEFGKKSCYRKHFIPERSKPAAIRLYNQINAA